MTGMFYNTIISWAVYYFAMSFHGVVDELPWKSCHHPWNSNCCVAADVQAYLPDSANATLVPNNCTGWVYSTEEYFLYVDAREILISIFSSFENSRHLQEKHKADKFNNLGKVKWELALSLLIVFIVVYFALWKGIKSSGKVRDCRIVRNSLE